MYAPITFFVYNRPARTRQTVAALQRKVLSKDSDLIIYSDAAKSESQTETVREVRDYIGEIDGFKLVEIVERHRNYGSADSVIDGVTPAVNKYGLIIVRDVELSKTPISLHTIKVESSQEGREAFGKSFRKNQTGLLRRWTRKAGAMLKGCR